MYVIKTKYRNQGRGVVGRTFGTAKSAEAFLRASGWRPDPYDRGSWEKAGPTRMMGQIGICVSEYVYIGEA